MLCTPSILALFIFAKRVFCTTAFGDALYRRWFKVESPEVIVQSSLGFLNTYSIRFTIGQSRASFALITTEITPTYWFYERFTDTCMSSCTTTEVVLPCIHCLSLAQSQSILFIQYCQFNMCEVNEMYACTSPRPQVLVSFVGQDSTTKLVRSHLLQ